MIGFYAAGAMGPALSVTTPEFVGATGTLTQSGTSIALVMPAGVTTGDLIIAAVCCRGDRNVSETTGWSELADLRSSTSTTGTRFKVFSTTYSGSPPSALAHSVNAAYGATCVAVRGGTIQQTGSDQDSATAIANLSAPSGALLIGFGSVNPRSTTGSNVPVGSQAGWTLEATGVYVTSASLLNYLVYAYKRVASGPPVSFEVGTSYGTETNRMGSVWACSVY